MARELHDELGPLLFGIRANAVALLDGMPPETRTIGPFFSVQGVIESVEALQQANRRILDQATGHSSSRNWALRISIETLLQNALSQAPDLKLTSRIDPGLSPDRWPARSNRLSRDPGSRDQHSPAPPRASSIHGSKRPSTGQQVI